MSILIDIDSQIITTDEFSIDNSKIELLKRNSDIISKYFKTTIEIGGRVKNSKKSSGNEFKQWITLFGEGDQRKLAKKFIFSLCKPDFEQLIRINGSILNDVSTENFKNEIIKKHQVYFDLLKENNDFFIVLKGNKNDVAQVKNIIDEISANKNNQKSANNSKSDNILEKMDDDSDVIWLDPSEIFDHQSKISTNNNRMEVESSLEKLNFVEDDLEVSSKSLSKLPPLNYPIENKNNLKKIKNSNDSNNNTSLNEYVEMFENQEFDPQEEKLNKFKRIDKLISAMDDKQQAIAVNQVKAHSTRSKSTPKINKIEINSNEILEEDMAKSKINEEDINEPSLIILDDSDDEISNRKKNDKNKLIQNSSNKNKVNKPIPVFQNKINDIQSDDLSNTNNFSNNFTDANFISINHNVTSQKKNINNNSNNKKNHQINRNRSRDIKQLSIRNNRSKSSINTKQMHKNDFKSINRDDSNINFNLNQNQNLVSTIPTVSSNIDIKNTNDNLRFIIIDGSNVAREHGNNFGKAFSCIGIKIVVDYFLKRGHKDIKALVPRFRRGQSDLECPTINPEILDELEKNGYLTYTPSRYVNNKLICPYDDRFILRAAEHYNAIIVSNDNYRDLMLEKYEWKLIVERNLLQYTFIGDLFMIADDPFGRKGPTINEFLSNDQKYLNKISNKNNFTNQTKKNKIKHPHHK